MRLFRNLQILLLIAPGLLVACGPSEAADGAGTARQDAEEVVGSDGPYLLVVNKSSKTLSVVDPETGTEVKVIETGFAPHEVAVSHDGRFAYVTDYGTGGQPGNTVTVVDLEAMAVSGTISLAPHTRPHGVA
ncbi:MAG: hypothetical protein KJN92_02595, partial [Gemmatimonadetes bacterium]|nr:hypothetical protein [Gemmatimonadota bacterium]